MTPFVYPPRNFPNGRAVLDSTAADDATTLTLVTGGVAELRGDSETPYVIRAFEEPLSGNPEDVTVVEYMLVTGVSGEVLTVTRGEQDSVAAEWPAGTIIETVLTEAEMAQIKVAIIDIETRIGSGDSAVALTVPITVAGNYEVRGDGSITNHIDYDDSGTDAIWKIRANNTTDIVSVTEAGAMTVAGTLAVGGMITGTGTGTNMLALQRDINTAGSLARINLQMKSSTGVYRTYGEVAAEVVTNTNAAEFGEIRLNCIRNGSLVVGLRQRASGSVFHYILSGLPTSNPGAGILWNDSNTLKIGT
jgi:hypothetical protein